MTTTQQGEQGPMDWVRLYTTHHDDPALAEAGEAAEILHTRAKSYAGRHETGGYISPAVVKILTPARTQARVAALVRVGLWEKVDGRDGWLIASWEDEQSEHDALANKRRADRERIAKKRQEKKTQADPPRDMSRDMSRDSRGKSRARGEERREDRGDTDPPGASVDAGEPHAPDQPSERTAAQHLAARYNAGVRLADPGQALRTIADALAEGVPERLVAGGVEYLIGEQRSCTRGSLRVALLKAEGNWGAPGTAGQSRPGNPYLDDMRRTAAATGTALVPLALVPDPLALEAT